MQTIKYTNRRTIQRYAHTHAETKVYQNRGCRDTNASMSTYGDHGRKGLPHWQTTNHTKCEFTFTNVTTTPENPHKLVSMVRLCFDLCRVVVCTSRCENTRQRLQWWIRCCGTRLGKSWLTQKLCNDQGLATHRAPGQRNQHDHTRHHKRHNHTSNNMRAQATHETTQHHKQITNQTSLFVIKQCLLIAMQSERHRPQAKPTALKHPLINENKPIIAK